MADKLRYLLLSIDSPLCRQLGGLVIDDSVTFPCRGFEVTIIVVGVHKGNKETLRGRDHSK